ncbi:MAG TPA: MotA/TolQ/ExbB proton channel family protein [Polyangiaceae bacterium]|nr:MotA/TolQ/ExbB proton channel family protein [Polyangiaceae bacterium]
MIVEKLLKVALLGASWVMYLMLALSVLSIGAIVERWWFFFRRNIDVDDLEEQLLAHLSKDDTEGAKQYLEKSRKRSFEAEAVLPALRYFDAGCEAFSDCVEAEVIKLRQDMEKSCNLLATLGNNAPFIGLMGTVIGVIISFHELGSNQAASAMGNVMGGIAEALVSTAVGLFLALPAVVAYNVIQQKVTDIESNVESIKKQVSALLKSKHHLSTHHQTSTSVMRSRTALIAEN